MRTAVRISVGGSKRLQRLTNGLSLALAAASGIGLMQCDYRYLFLLLAVAVLRRSLRTLDPTGVTLAFTPATGWSFSIDPIQRRQASGSRLRMVKAGADESDGFTGCGLHVRGRTPGLIWLDVQSDAAVMNGPRAADLPGLERISGNLLRALPPGLSARRACRSWLIFADALPEADWRCLRRTLRLQAYRGEGLGVPG